MLHDTFQHRRRYNIVAAYFAGEIPASLGQLIYLKYLTLGQNNLSGKKC